MIYLAFIIGIVAGLRAMLAPAAVSWAAASGLLPLANTWLSFLGWRFTPWVFSLFAIGELISDQLPKTPSRKVPVQFGTRILMGAVCGAAIGVGAGNSILGLILGVVGAVIGTLGGAEVRARMAGAFGRDRPAALIEDAVAIAGAVFVACSL